MVKRRHDGHGGLKNSGDDGRRTQELLQTEADHVLSWIDQEFCDAKAVPNPVGSSHGDGSHLTPLPKTRSPCADHSAAIGVCNSVVEYAKESHSVGGIKKDTKEDNVSAVPVGSMEDKENMPPCFNTLITEAATGWITVKISAACRSLDATEEDLLVRGSSESASLQ
ncbi:hypothetical protein KI387_004289, partial [Taxus chinensis]